MEKYKVFEEDKEGIIQAGFPDAPYYTNSSQLPVNYTNDAFEALDLQDDLQCKYTGGCVEKGNLVWCVDNENKIFAIKIEELYDRFCTISAKEWRDKYRVISFDSTTQTAVIDNIIEAIKIDVSEHDKIRVIGENGLNIVTSDWHPFFVKKGDKVIEVRADELHAGDMLVSSILVGKNEFVKVISTTKVDVEDNDFYDLTTEKHHNYLCSNTWDAPVFIHNTVFHLYMSERVSSVDTCKSLVKNVLSNYRMPYISITPTFSTCPKHGYIKGAHDYCPYCDAELMQRHADEVNPNA